MMTAVEIVPLQVTLVTRPQWPSGCFSQQFRGCQEGTVRLQDRSKVIVCVCVCVCVCGERERERERALMNTML
jgi:hypothetical protein